MPLPPIIRLILLALSSSLLLSSLHADPVRRQIPLADGFDYPCGDPVGSGENYYIYRGWTRGHPGEDWNGNGGGNTDLGDPVYNIADGIVVYARNAGGGWGNTVIVRHAYRDPRTGVIKVVDSYHTHLNRINVRHGQAIAKGTQVGEIGTNNGMYTAHLHFEIRHGPGLLIGTHRGRHPVDMAHYHRPKNFIDDHRNLRPERRTRATVRIDTDQFEGN